MGAALTKLCCCCLGQRRKGPSTSLLLAPSLAPSRGSSPSLTEPFFSAHSSPERPPLKSPLSPSPPLALTIVSTSPLAVLIPSFLTTRQCQALIYLAQPHLRASKVCGAGVCSDRQSSSMFFTAPWATHIPEVGAMEAAATAVVRAAAAAQGRAVLTPVEATQIVRYTAGQFYAQHHDNDPAAGTSRLQRAATLIVYLSDVGGGGETAFPAGRVAGTPAGVGPWGGEKGFKVFSRAGQALLFWSALPGGGPDPAAVHAAAAVTDGEKWIATRWFREVEQECTAECEKDEGAAAAVPLTERATVASQ